MLARVGFDSMSIYSEARHTDLSYKLPFKGNTKQRL